MEPVCNCGADRTGPTAEAHLWWCAENNVGHTGRFRISQNDLVFFDVDLMALAVIMLLTPHSRPKWPIRVEAVVDGQTVFSGVLTDEEKVDISGVFEI
jgi:hypothetical protein